MMKKFSIKIAILSLFASLLINVACSNKTDKEMVWLSTGFHEPAIDGLRYIYSADGLHWDTIGGVWLTPSWLTDKKVGEQPVMRDPSIIRSKDGKYHLVWTCAWRGLSGFGFSSSTNLYEWDAPQFVPAMEYDSTTVNVWAPEFFYDPDQDLTYVIWASCIPGAYPDYLEDHLNNHRLYCTTTRDFKEFTPTKLFYEPGFSVIDATLVYRGPQDYVMVLKDNTRPCRNLRIAFAPSAEGPWTEPSAPFTEGMCEGPTVIAPEVLNGDYLIYYDAYSHACFGAMRTSDFINFTDYTDSISVPEGHKHGTMIRVPMSDVQYLLDKQ